MKAWPVVPILVVQIVLLFAHWFIYSTWIAFWPGLPLTAIAALRIAMLVLAFSFVAASLLSFRYSNIAARLFYLFAAAWLGLLNYLFWVSYLVWIAWFAIRSSHLAANPAAARSALVSVLYGVAALTGVCGLINARIIRVRRVAVEIANLPASWRGRRAVLMSDLHLGPVNGARFCRRLVAKASILSPDIVVIPGDLFDGTKADLDNMIAPLKQLRPPFGVYFSTGNHEEFTDSTHYIEAVRRAGIRVLADEFVIIDGVQLAGVLYRASSSPLRMKTALDSMGLDRTRAGILLNHAPVRLPIVEQAGFGLQLSGHTHGGQFTPFTWITRRVYGRFTSGLHRFNTLQVFTSVGAGTWGPPLRVGNRPEIVLLTFE